MKEANLSDEDILYRARAQAAFMLLETLVLELLGRKVLSTDNVFDAVQSVIEAKRQLIADGDEDKVAQHALGLLATFQNSVSARDENA